MAYHITRAGSPINSATIDSIEAAIADFTAPAYKGAPSGTVTMINETRFQSSGLVYEIVAGENPKEARAAALTASRTRNASGHRSALDANGKFRGSAWLSREMEREDSDY